MKIIDVPSKPKGVVGVIYGPEGIGKTTLAAALDNPLFLDAEKGAHGFKVAKLDEEVSFTNIKKVMKELKSDNNGYKTLVIDTMDAAEQKFLDRFLVDNRWESIETPAYGQGYADFAREIGSFLDGCREVAESGMNVIFVCHAEVKKFETPDERGSYDRWQLKLMKQVSPLVKQCADFIVFVNYKTNIVAADKKAGETKSHAIGGRRWCYTSHTTAFDAKCRKFIDLPDECALDDMIKTLPVALRNAIAPVAPKADAPTTDDQKTVPAKGAAAKPKTEKKPQPPAPEENVRPLVKKLRDTLKAYNAPEDKLFAKYNVKHTERHGAVESIDDWCDTFIGWILTGFAKGRINLDN